MSLNFVLQPMVAACTIFGTMPFEIILSTPLKLRVSSYIVVYSCVIVVLTVCNIYFTQTRIVQSEINFNTILPLVPPSVNCNCLPLMDNGKQSNAQSRVIQLMNPHILIFMSLGANLLSFGKIGPKFPIFVDYLEAIDAKLYLLMVHQNRSFRSTYLILGVFFPAFLSASFPILTYYFYLSSHNDTFHSFWYGSVVLHNLISYSSELQLVTFFLLLKSKYRVINNSLNLMSRRNRRPLSKSRKIFTESTNSKDEMVLKYIETTHNCFLKLWDSWTLLNQMYNVQVLLSTCGCFLKALFNVYLMLISGSADAEGRLNPGFFINYALWMFFYFCRFSMQAVVASSAINEAHRTKSIVAYLTIDQKNPAILEELDLFWLNAKCRNLEFSACGLFRLNSELILRACATGITYLVLLVQFKPQMVFT